MKLRNRKRLINACTAALVVGAAGAAGVAWRSPPPAIEAAAPRSPSGLKSAASTQDALIVRTDSPSWSLVLRRPLYDPPPPPPQEVVIQQRPITVQLVGTVIEPDNSQAFIRQASGAVELKKVGDQVSADPADGVIGQITASEIVIRREDGEHHVSVQRQN